MMKYNTCIYRAILCFGYSLELCRYSFELSQDNSNEYPQHGGLEENKQF